MFSDFDEDAKKAEGRGRMGASFGLSMLIFAGLAVAVGTAVATAHTIVKRKKDVAVEFASLPPPPKVEQKKPEPKVVKKKKRKKAKRKHIKPPKEIPEERPEESDEALTEAEDTGPIDGVLDCEPGEECDGDGNGPAPEPTQVEVAEDKPARRAGQKRETVTRPKLVSGCKGFTPPEEVQQQAATIRIKVRSLIQPDGVPLRVRILEGHPLIPDEMVIKCAMEQRFEPARLPDGLAVPYPYISRFVFRPSNL